MSTHLRSQEFVDALDGHLEVDRLDHLEACAACRAELAGLRALLTEVTPAGAVPDPSPLFWNHFSDPSEQFFAGVWAATRGRWRVRYTETEFCHLLAGRVILVGEDGERNEFSAGDSFVIPSGFSGSWEVVEDCRKLYVIFEPR